MLKSKQIFIARPVPVRSKIDAFGNRDSDGTTTSSSSSFNNEVTLTIGKKNNIANHTASVIDEPLFFGELTELGNDVSSKVNAFDHTVPPESNSGNTSDCTTDDEISQRSTPIGKHIEQSNSPSSKSPGCTMFGSEIDLTGRINEDNIGHNNYAIQILEIVDELNRYAHNAQIYMNWSPSSWTQRGKSHLSEFYTDLLTKLINENPLNGKILNIIIYVNAEDIKTLPRMISEKSKITCFDQKDKELAESSFLNKQTRVRVNAVVTIPQTLYKRTYNKPAPFYYSLPDYIDGISFNSVRDTDTASLDIMQSVIENNSDIKTLYIDKPSTKQCHGLIGLSDVIRATNHSFHEILLHPLAINVTGEMNDILTLLLHKQPSVHTIATTADAHFSNTQSISIPPSERNQLTCNISIFNHVNQKRNHDFQMESARVNNDNTVVANSKMDWLYDSNNIIHHDHSVHMSKIAQIVSGNKLTSKDWTRIVEQHDTQTYIMHFKQLCNLPNSDFAVNRAKRISLMSNHYNMICDYNRLTNVERNISEDESMHIIAKIMEYIIRTPDAITPSQISKALFERGHCHAQSQWDDFMSQRSSNRASR